MDKGTLVGRLKEFELGLKYSFRIDISDYFSVSKKGPIVDAATGAFKICTFFLNQNAPHFFGIANQVPESLSAPNTDPIFSLFSSVDFKNRWKKILLDDAVVSFYSLLRDIVVGQSKVDASTALQCANELDNPEKLLGMEYLLEKGTIVLDKNMKLSLKDKSDRSVQMRKYLISHNSSYRSQLKNIDKMLAYIPGHERFVIHDAIKTHEDLYLGNAEYAGALRAVSKQLKILNKIYSQEDSKFYGTHCQKYAMMCQRLIEVPEQCEKLKKADILYAKYKMERELHICLSDCLYQNITALEMKQKSSMFGKRDIKELAQCVKLPNVFSRNLIVDSAFIALENILASPVSAQNDFFSQILSELRGGGVTYGNSDAYLSPFDAWMTLYRRMVDYLADFLFPLYESVFMLLLYRLEMIRAEKELDDEIRKQKRKSKTKRSIQEYALYSVFKGLGQYLNEQDINKEVEKGIKQEVYDPIGGHSKQKTFEGIEKTHPKFSNTVDRNHVQKYKWCISTMTEKAVTAVPLGLADLNALIPDKEALWKHSILQVAKVSEYIY